MKVLIVDDEALARARLRSLLEQGEMAVSCVEADNGREALEAIGQQRPDVVLLDIRMPVMDGLEAARHISGLEQPPAVIFTTAYDEYALKAFEAHAIDYLLKPVRGDRLADALGRARALTRMPAELVLDESGRPVARTHISAMQKDRIRLIPVDDIRYFQADLKYVSVGWPGGEVLIDDSLKSLGEEFGERFLQVHRNALIARQYLTGLVGQGDNHCIELDGVDAKPVVSRRHLSEVRKILKSR